LVDRSENYEKFMEQMGVNMVKRKLARSRQPSNSPLNRPEKNIHVRRAPADGTEISVSKRAFSDNTELAPKRFSKILSCDMKTLLYF
uniref:Uncharacterized protein n=1 Tax=Salarias fasciatus TaxID=181472 RepID=A0A672FNY7_SALFA